jgi:16S rRNA (cytosine967-C5)-methyltransferase
VKRAQKTSAKGFVNAILRRAVKGDAVLSYSSDAEQVSVETSHPAWLIEKWAHDHGRDRAHSIARANNQMPRSAFRPLTDNFDIAGLAARPSEFVTDCFIPERVDARLITLANEGQIYFQDEASQLAAQTVVIPDGGRFFDVCASPGGKTGSVARRHTGRTALIVAGDLHFSRAKVLKDNCRRQGVRGINVVQYDARVPLPFDEEQFDAVLVDAPCSGTGTIRHNPEIRYLIKPDDFGELSAKQRLILTNASKMVKRGGTLTYSTCSIEPEENEAVCTSFLFDNPGFGTVRPELPERFLVPEMFARTWPDRDEMDGFFIAAFTRR